MDLLTGTMTWQEAARHALLLIVAYALALPTAFDRERHAQGAGLRTFPLVALGACAYMLVGRQVLEIPDAQSRVVYGIITGIGFIGGGAILKGEKETQGTATAASIWLMGGIGIAVAWQRFDIAIVLSVTSFITLLWGGRFKTYIGKRDSGADNLTKPDSPPK
jgi:putative Mg2+ transporter-C (MgtC) family protein